jgi:hypothetical protein
MTKITRREAGKLILVCGASALVHTKLLHSQGYPGEWTAQWIWENPEPQPFHFFMMARRSFDLDNKPDGANLKITAADRYMLYLNGKYLGRGPARSDPRWTSYDLYDLAPELRTGKNTIAVLAYHYGCNNNYTRMPRAGLFAQLDLTRPGGAPWVMGTDQSWRVRQAEGWRRDVQLINNAVGVTEAYDANLDPGDWMSPDFDDSTWKQAYVIPKLNCPWSYLEARQTPMLMETEVFPARVLKTGEVQEILAGVMTEGFRQILSETQIPERLQLEPHFPLQYAKVVNPERVLADDDSSTEFEGSSAEVRAARFKYGAEMAGQGAQGESLKTGVRSPFIIVDFGKAVFGFPKIRLQSPANAVVEMTYGPVINGDRVPAVASGVRYGDRYVTRAGKQTWQVFEYKQFRYLQLVVRAAEPVSVDSISMVSYDYPASRTGTFECSDAVLNTLWKACVDTTYLHMEDDLISDAVRERRGWTGDGGHGLYGIFAGYGGVALIDRYFRLFARSALPDGMLRMVYPGTEETVGERRSVIPGMVSDNPENIPQFALFYVVFAGEYYKYYGRLELVREIYPALVALAQWCRNHANEDGLLYNLPNHNFVDWRQTDMRGANLETNALYCKMLAEMTVIARDLGKLDEAEQWNAASERVKGALRRLHWNPDKGIYVDSVDQGKQSETVTEVSNGMALMWGIATPDQTASIVERMGDPRAEIVRASPLYFYYALEGLVEAGAIKIALEQMRSRYSPMLDAFDNPTIWEAWEGVEAHFSFAEVSTVALYGSLSHSGGVGPAWTLSKYVLGVHPVGPGFRKCRIEPATDGLEWARGVFPSVRGDIKVDWKKEGRQMSYDIALPAGLETELILPRDPGRNLLVVHNGKKYEVRAVAKAVTGLVLSESKVGVNLVGENHRVEMSQE